ncbi:MAG: hypothetical protein LBU46_01720, partial [Candidatus Accumulibacter sp.]|nr:hypothetical protein [Accumulibacter sp.]
MVIDSFTFEGGRHGPVTVKAVTMGVRRVDRQRIILVTFTAIRQKLSTGGRVIMTRGDSWRAALSRRFGALPLARALIWGFWIVYFLSVLLVLSLRYAILPHIENYRPVIERMAGESIGQKVSIGRVEAGWAGINPDLTLYDVSVADAQGRPALTFSRVETVLSWRSALERRWRLVLLRIDQPTLHMRRGGDGRVFIAGIPLAQQGGGSGMPPWLLAQAHIRIGGATLVWEDESRRAPTLTLKEVNIALDNDGRHHRFGLTALPPSGLAARIDVRGDFRGGASGAFDEWRGQAFAEVAYADLAAWARWVDYPAALPRGRGAARAWRTFDGGGWRELTADVALRDVDLKLGEELPALNLENLSGRVQADF